MSQQIIERESSMQQPRLGATESLAIAGAEPAFAQKLFVGRPNIGEREAFLGRVNDILDRQWLTNNGTYVQEFERTIAEFLGVKHCIAMCNATVGLEIAIKALGLKGEVIVPSFTFVASPHSLQWQEITPVFCDVDPVTHNIDPAQIEKLITPRTTGIMGVHIWGRPCDTAALEAIAKRHKLKLLFDAAHAFGCSRQGRMIGSFGDAEVFSFHATKFFNTLEGGAVTTNDDELAARIRLMKNFGFSGFDQVDYIGTNGKMNEVCAAMGLTSFESLERFIETNRRNQELYTRGLAGVPGVQVLAYDEAEKNNFQYLVLEIEREQSGVSRDDLMHVLWAENVIARRYFYPGCHRMEPYASYFPHASLLLPQTESLCQKVLLLPNGTAVDEDAIARICGVIRAAVQNAERVSALVKRAITAADDAIEAHGDALAADEEGANPLLEA